MSIRERLVITLDPEKIAAQADQIEGMKRVVAMRKIANAESMAEMIRRRSLK